jgi:phosphate transport system substrate-binding protein
MVSTRTLALAALAAVTAAGAAEARDQIRIVGSSTVFPYTQAVAEEYSSQTGAPAPVVESTGTGGGFKIFCQGLGPEHPDVTGASRPIKDSEKKACAGNGVVDITEAHIGYDGISIAISRDGPDLDLTEAQIFLALAAEVPAGGAWVANPNKTWKDVDASLPDMPIQVYGPPPTSGTRDAFVELALHDGCDTFPEAAALSKDEMKVKCGRMRQDGPFIEAGENDNLIVQRLQADATALGIFGYSFLYENEDTLKAVKVNGVAPDFDTIADNSYPIARPIFFYVKNAHRGVIPGLNEFLEEYMSEAALAPGGYLNERGLVPLSDEARKEVQAAVLGAKQISMMK